MTGRDLKAIKSDIVAIVLVAAVIGLVFFFTWLTRTVNDTTPITRLVVDTTERIRSFVYNYDTLTPVQIMTADFKPQVFINAAKVAPDQGSANDLLYVAELIKKYNEGARVDTLKEAYDILTEVVPHIRDVA